MIYTAKDRILDTLTSCVTSSRDVTVSSADRTVLEMIPLNFLTSKTYKITPKTLLRKQNKNIAPKTLDYVDNTDEHKMCITLASYNMHGFTSNWKYLQDLCRTCNLIVIEEHWLASSQLHYLDDIDPNFMCYSKSAMDDVLCDGLLTGRPFGGVSILYNKNLGGIISFVAADDGRVICVKLKTTDVQLLLFGCYFPYNDHGLKYKNSLSNVIGFIEAILDEHPGYKACVIGDLNFECRNGNIGFEIFNDFASAHNLVCCDDIEDSKLGFTYHHDALGHRSMLDHLFIDGSLITHISTFSILQDGANTSDHLPIVANITFDTSHTPYSINKKCEKNIREYRWDKGDLIMYYEATRIALDKIQHIFTCDCETSCCSISDHCIDINIYYAEIVNCLKCAADYNIPRLPRSALKHYWSAELDELKQGSKDTYDLWIILGRPQSGDIYQLMRNAKYKYKLALRQSIQSFENRFSDELYESLIHKNFTGFWKTWKSKCVKNKTIAHNVDGLYIDSEIAECFKSKFSILSDPTDVVSQLNRTEIVNGIDISNWLLRVDDIDKVVFESMKRGKSPGLDSVVIEHVMFSHPSIMVHLTRLFNLMIKHGFVPSSFGEGVIIPLLKDKSCDICSSDNYRGITLSPIISKIFESCILIKINSFLATHDLQIGF